jgi:hypothetical protein
MPQRPVWRRAGNRCTPPPRPASAPRLVADWAGWDAAVAAFIEERGSQGARAFGEGQADNYRSILQGDRCRQWRTENEIQVPEDVTAVRVERLKQDLPNEAEVRPASAQQYVKNLKTFLRWCRTTGFVIDRGAPEVPDVDLGDGEPPDPFSRRRSPACQCRTAPRRGLVSAPVPRRHGSATSARAAFPGPVASLTSPFMARPGRIRTRMPPGQRPPGR